MSFKDFDISNLYKKCGFRKADGFELRHKYEKVKVNGERIDVHVFHVIMVNLVLKINMICLHQLIMNYILEILH